MRSRPSARPALEALEVRLAPAVYTVTSVLDDGSAGTLRDCITKANSTVGVADTIAIETTQPIVLKSQLQIKDSVAIVGAGASGLSLIERDAANPSMFGLFDITSQAGNVTLANLDLTGGHALLSTAGGAVSNAANLTLQNCWIHDNTSAAIGGGVYTTGKLTVADCLFQANSAAGGFGGGIYVDSANASITGTTFLTNRAGEGGGVYAQTGNRAPITVVFRDCTFSGNQATAGNGGALATGAYSGDLTADLFDCTLANNTASGGFGGAYSNAIDPFSSRLVYQGSLFANNSSTNLGGGGLTSLGHNLSTDFAGMVQGMDIVTSKPGLGTLGFYGGATPTIPLLPGSPAIDAGVVIVGIGTDQRGVSRFQGAAPDIGAFEVRPQRIGLATRDQFANVGTAFSRGGSVTGDGDATVYVDYGDSNGALASPVPYGPGSRFTLSHAYAAEGTYVVTVRLIDSTGKTLDTRQFKVDVFLAGVDTTQIDEQTTSGPGIATVTAVDPIDGSSVTATLLHVAPSDASILVGIVPAGVFAALNGSSQIAGDSIASSYELRAVSVDGADEILVVFHYASDNFDTPVLHYYNRATGQEGVVSSDTYIIDRVAKTITLILDKGSIPGILDIGGTVFTIAVPHEVSVSLDENVVLSLEHSESDGFGSQSFGGGGSASTFPASFQMTGRQAFVVFASFLSFGGPLEDGAFGDRFAAPDRANLLAELPIVPDTLITLPGPILTPGSTEMPVPNEPPKVTTPPAGGAPATSRLDGDVVDEVFVHFDDGRSVTPWDDMPDEPPTDWRDTSLAIAAFLAARPAGPRRRSFANATVER